MDHLLSSISSTGGTPESIDAAERFRNISTDNQNIEKVNVSPGQRLIIDNKSEGWVKPGSFRGICSAFVACLPSSAQRYIERRAKGTSLTVIRNDFKAMLGIESGSQKDQEFDKNFDTHFNIKSDSSGGYNINEAYMPTVGLVNDFVEQLFPEKKSNTLPIIAAQSGLPVAEVKVVASSNLLRQKLTGAQASFLSNSNLQALSKSDSDLPKATPVTESDASTKISETSFRILPKGVNPVTGGIKKMMAYTGWRTPSANASKAEATVVVAKPVSPQNKGVVPVKKQQTPAETEAQRQQAVRLATQRRLENQVFGNPTKM